MPIVLMIIVVIILKMIVPINLNSKMSCVIYVGLIALVGGFTYIVVAYKTGVLSRVFGKEYINRIIKKLTFGKVSLKK